MVLSCVGPGSVGAAVVTGTTIAQSGPANPGSQKHRFIFVHTYENTHRVGYTKMTSVNLHKFLSLSVHL